MLFFRNYFNFSFNYFVNQFFLLIRIADAQNTHPFPLLFAEVSDTIFWDRIKRLFLTRHR